VRSYSEATATPNKCHRVHNEVVRRASHLSSLSSSSLQPGSPYDVSRLLESRGAAAAVQAGAFFPDWGYQCLSTDDDAEAAHWPPFLIAAVEHITSKYGLLNNTRRPPAEQRHLENLVSFIYAVASHQAADATWHALRLPTGLLAAMTGVDFDGDEDSAHTTLDVGADFLMAARLARLPEEGIEWIERSWVVPVNDLAQIYERIGRSISKPVLRYCCMRGLAALRSELALGEGLWQTFATRSPMLLDEVDGYYLGGMDEMSARTLNCWANLTSWFEEGIDEHEKLRGGYGICDVFQAIRSRGGGTDYHRSDFHKHGIFPDRRLLDAATGEMANINVSTDAYGAETYTLPRRATAEASSKPYSTKANTNRWKTFGRCFDKQPAHATTRIPYSHFGASITAGRFLADSKEISLAIGAPWESEDLSRPGEGNVYIVPMSYITGTSQEKAPGSEFEVHLSSSFSPRGLGSFNEPFGRRARDDDPATHGMPSSVDQRFGTASTSLKTLNSTFLVVSAPGPIAYDPDLPPSLPFQSSSPGGRVDLFLPGEAKPAYTFSVRGAELGSIGRRQWGNHLLSADLDGSGDEFLVVSSSRDDEPRICHGRLKPQYGEGSVTVLRIRRSTGQPPLVPTGTLSQIMLERANASMTFCVSSSSSDVRAHSCYSGADPKGSTTTDGGIVVDAWELTLPPQEKYSTPCETTHTYEYFGHSTIFSAVSRTLWISAPGRGKLFGYRFESDSFSLVAEIADPDFALRQQRTGFGHALAAWPTVAGEYIAVSAPNEPVENSKQVGVVRIYRLPSAGPPVLEREIIPQETQPYTKFGRTLVASSAGTLYVSSEWAYKERGAVWWVRPPDSQAMQNLGQWVLDKPEDRYEKAEVILQSSEEGTGFGASLAVVESADKVEVIIGVPWAAAGSKQYQRFAGEVVVWRHGCAK
jgi:glycosylphosphatidylinositol phospholipase D